MKKIVDLTLVACWLCFLATLIGCPSSDGGGGGGGGDDGYSVSGTISAVDNSAIDSDVNDIFTIPVSNNSFGAAQVLPNPAILGGYVNVAFFGGDGNSYESGDLRDYYSVYLTDNQSITLSIADSGNANIDLFLYDAGDTDNPVDTSEGVGFTEIVSVPAAGNYFIEVRAISGASNYILVIGKPITSATILDPRMNEDFKPGNVIVAFNDDMPAFNIDLKKTESSAFNAMAHKSSILDHIQVYKFTSETKDQVFQSMGIAPTESNRALYQTSNPEDQLKLDTLRIIDALNKDPRVRYAEPNYRRYPTFVPDDPEYSKQWHYPIINMPQAWEITKGQDVIVAVIDTGILANHPDMVNQLVAGYDFISDDEVANDNEPGIDSNPEDPGDEEQGGSSFHGTHVSGTVAAASNNAKGVAGVAFEAKIMPLRALGVGGGFTDDILECMKYAAGMVNDSGETPVQPAHIINMSLGGGGYQQASQDVIDIITNAPYNVIVVAAAGNESTSDLSYPASYDGVISVSAVGPDKELASYSNFGSKIDVAAPGGDFDSAGGCVYSTSGNDDGDSILNVYSYACGTSMASPHMAGVVALMKAVYPAMTPSELDTFIQSGSLTEDLTGDGPAERNDNFGYGLIDAFKAVSYVADPTQIPTFLVVNPLSLNFGTTTTELPISATATNDNNPLSILSVSDDAAWLEVTADSVDADNLGDYSASITIDRDSLPDGPYYATITFDADGSDDVEISVIMYVGDIFVPGDSGLHYVFLIDSVTLLFQFDTVSASNGAYSYSFPSVPKGEYYVLASTDLDNDLDFVEAGEASGIYKSWDEITTLNVNRNLSGINFNSTFEQIISATNLATKLTSGLTFQKVESE
jgi:serine protease